MTALRTRVCAVLGTTAVLLAGCADSSTPVARHASASSVPVAPRSTAVPTPSGTPSTSARPTADPTTRPAPTATSPASTSSTSHSSATHSSASHPSRSRLPLSSDTHDARQVVTVVADSTASTTGILQTWRKDGSGWVRVGPAVAAWLGSDGLSTHPSESRSATPIGSFTLTQAFGHDANPGTALPYTHTTPSDWWISQAGPLYNTRQRCSSDCAFTQGNPNEHLYYETPDYDYAVVIDYNTRNAPGGVRQGAGSAFFLHVTEYRPTAGCVSIPMDQVVRILRWLRPAEHPRILIGIA